MIVSFFSFFIGAEHSSFFFLLGKRRALGLRRKILTSGEFADREGGVRRTAVIRRVLEDDERFRALRYDALLCVVLRFRYGVVAARILLLY